MNEVTEFPKVVGSATPDTGLASRAMLCDVTVRQWNPEKRDAEITEEIEKAKGVTGDAGRFIKNLVDRKAPAMREVRRAISDLKKYHELTTSPWAERGVRILLAAKFADYEKQMKGHYIPAFDKAADALEKALDGPDGLFAKAKSELNEMYKEQDYPSPSEVRAAFRIDLRFRPLPVAGDWRVELSDVDMQRLKKATEDETKAIVMAATQDAYRRVTERVTAMVAKLQKLDKGESNRVFKSMVGNVREIAEALPALNIAGDPELDQLGLELRAKLCTHEAKELKEDANARKQTMDAAQELLSKMAGYMGDMA